MNIPQLFAEFRNLPVGVIGDVMLDTYMWGHVERISPEAPVPVVSVTGKEYRIGGAGNVALNLASLGAKASILSVTGKDEDGRQLRSMFEEKGIDTQFICPSSDRITTNKTRVISRNQQMMRLDTEVTHDLNSEEENQLLASVVRFLDEVAPAIVIFEDYNKGVLTERVIKEVLELCRQRNIPTAVDPKRRHFFQYKGVDIFKPNLKEVKEGLNHIEEGVSPELMDRIHAQLEERLGHRISFITLSEHGAYYHNGVEHRLIPSHRRNIADVSGAGDTVIAVAALVYAVTRNVYLMAEMANIAGGLVCEEVGTVAINSERLFQECMLLLDKQASV